MTTWTVLVPVRGGGRGKSRFPAAVGGVPRHRWVTAFATDTVAAIRRSERVERVVVVLSIPYPDLAEQVAADAAEPMAPASLLVVRNVDGLNESIAAAEGGGSPLAVFLGDLPSLTAADVSRTLSEAETVGHAVVPDAVGTGTVALGATTGALTPRFGHDSLAAHLAAGYVRLSASERVRRDVDTLADLHSALGLGVGAATAALADRAGLVSVPQSAIPTDAGISPGEPPGQFPCAGSAG